MPVDQNTAHKLLEQFSEYTKDPTQFLTNQPNIQKKFKNLVKQCYDNSKSLENQSEVPTFTLPKLLVDNFDAEQVWQQVELQNTFVCDRLDHEISALTTTLQSVKVISNNESRKDQNVIPDATGDTESKKKSKNVRFALPNEVSDDDSEENEDSEDENDENEDSEEEDGENEDLELEDFDNDDEKDEDAENEKDDEKDEDDDTDEDDEKNDELIARKKHESEDSDDNDKETKSSFEERQQRLKQHMEKLEDDLLAEKPWHLKGEVTAKKRPEDSLLNQVLEFDISSRPAPIITEEAALKLEDVIKNRIINRVWDDVERKVKPVDTPREFKKKLVLDQEKSKLSLAEVYEQDYLKQREAVSSEKKSEKEEEPKEHKQIRALMNSLFRKLDALSNYHYTPLPSIPEPQIVTNLAAVTLEEAVPDAISTATLLAPEEVQGKPKGDLVSKEERTATDKKRARRKKKIKQRLKHKAIKSKENELNKLNPGTKNNFAKEKVKKDLERLLKDKSVCHFKEDVSGKAKSSQQFFAKLEDAVSEQGKVKKRKKESNNIDPKRIKL